VANNIVICWTRDGNFRIIRPRIIFSNPIIFLNPIKGIAELLSFQVIVSSGRT